MSGPTRFLSFLFEDDIFTATVFDADKTMLSLSLLFEDDIVTGTVIDADKTMLFLSGSTVAVSSSSDVVKYRSGDRFFH